MEREDRFHVFTEAQEVDHALAHVGWWRAEVLWCADAETPLRGHAECLVRMFEARAHKQWYAVEARGTPPPSPPKPPRVGWSVIRQDEHGNRAEVAVHPSEDIARKLAAACDSEPRHQQAYFVEPVAPRS